MRSMANGSALGAPVAPWPATLPYLVSSPRAAVSHMSFHAAEQGLMPLSTREAKIESLDPYSVTETRDSSCAGPEDPRDSPEPSRDTSMLLPLRVTDSWPLQAIPNGLPNRPASIIISGSLHAGT